MTGGKKKRLRNFFSSLKPPTKKTFAVSQKVNACLLPLWFWFVFLLILKIARVIARDLVKEKRDKLKYYLVCSVPRVPVSKCYMVVPRKLGLGLDNFSLNYGNSKLIFR